MDPARVKLLALYTFPALTGREGIWETVSATGLGTPEAKFKLRLVVTWAGCAPLGTEWELIEQAFPVIPAHRIDRAALRGTPI